MKDELNNNPVGKIVVELALGFTDHTWIEKSVEFDAINLSDENGELIETLVESIAFDHIPASLKTNLSFYTMIHYEFINQAENDSGTSE